jgi:hypothetical protein
MPPTRHSWRWPDADHPSRYPEGRRLESRPLPHDREPPPTWPSSSRPSKTARPDCGPFRLGRCAPSSRNTSSRASITGRNFALQQVCLHSSTDVGSSWFLDAMIEAPDFDKSVPRQGQRGRRPSAGQVLARLLAVRFAKRDSPGPACERISDIRQIGDPRRISNCDARVPFSPRAGNAERSGTNQYHFRPPPAAPGH